MEDRSRRRARLILIVGLIFALIAGAGTYYIASQAPTAAPPPAPTTEVLVAAREVPARTALAATDLKKVQMNTDVVPAAAVKTEAEVIGKVTTTPLSTGELLLTTRFLAGVQPFTVFPPGQIPAAGQPIPPTAAHYRAFSITVPDGLAVGGKILIGDIVDILYTLKIDPETLFLFPGPTGAKPPTAPQVADVSAKVAVERVPIIDRTLTVYTIRTDAATAERLGYLQAAGAQLQLLLRAPQDDRVVNTQGQTLAPVLQEFRFRVPLKISP